MIFVNNDICQIKVDAIVNAANGVGYMGGTIGKYFKRKGVSENIHFATKGKVQKEAKKTCINKKHPFGLKEGNVFITGAYGLPSKNIIHAVTMHFPGTKSKIQTIEVLIDKIIKLSFENGYDSIAVPLLGTGTGGLDKRIIRELFIKKFQDITSPIVYVMDNEVKYCPACGKLNPYKNEHVLSIDERSKCQCCGYEDFPSQYSLFVKCPICANAAHKRNAKYCELCGSKLTEIEE